MRAVVPHPFISRFRSSILSSLSLRPLSDASASHFHLHPSAPTFSHPSKDLPNPNPRTLTPSEKHFDSWISKLRPGFTPSDVDEALQAQSDPDLALDIFRWTGQQRGYKHNHVTYLRIIRISISGKRYRVAETLVEEVLAGACPPSLPLYNSMIKFCCGRKSLFNRAFDVYKKMLACEDAKPSLETYTLLLNALLRKFNRLTVSYVYLHSVRSLAKQMKASGVIPDTFALNMIIKAYSKCLEVDEAIRVFCEMGLYGCQPNAYTYSYLAKGLCEKGRVNQGRQFYKDMRDKGFVPKGSTYVILICSLAMERRFEDAIEVVFDMLSNSMSPDLLTYKTLLEEMCRDGKGEKAFDLLEEFRKRDNFMNEKTYKSLLDVLHFLMAPNAFNKMVEGGIYGLGPVLAALSAGRRELYALYLQEGLDLSRNKRKPKDNKGSYLGLVLCASELERVGIKELDPVLVEGQMVLICANFAPLTGAVDKVSPGSLELVDVRYCKNTELFVHLQLFGEYTSLMKALVCGDEGNRGVHWVNLALGDEDVTDDGCSGHSFKSFMAIKSLNIGFAAASRDGNLSYPTGIPVLMGDGNGKTFWDTGMGNVSRR
nr:pentatricopeptide repeat-containing protein At3g25210, mitochondrial [Ipomoea batatas]